MTFFRKSSLLTYLILFFLSVQSCDLINAVLSCDDGDGGNTFFVQEFISDSTFSEFTPLRHYQFGDNDSPISLTQFEFTLDKRMSFSRYFRQNYGAQLSTFQEDFKLIPNKGTNNTECKELIDLSNPDLNKSLCRGLTPGTSIDPFDSDSIFSDLEMIFQFEHGTSVVDTVFRTEYAFLDSTTYIDNYIQDAAFDINGVPLILLFERINYLLNNGVYESTKTVNKRIHLIRAYSQTNYDTLYSYEPDISIEEDDQFYFSSLNSGIFIKLHDDVFLLKDDKDPQFLYSGGLPDRLPNRSNLIGDLVFSDVDQQVYDLTKNKHIDLSRSFEFRNIGFPYYGQISNNGLLAVLLGSKGSITNDGKIVIYNTDQESVTDSVTIKDLTFVKQLSNKDSIQDFLTNPIFTSDNRLIFMYAYWEQDMCIGG